MQISISGIPKPVVEGIDALAEKYDLSRSEIIRTEMASYVADRDDVPEHLRKDAAFERITDENRWRMRVLWFETNVTEWFNDALERDHQPDPERVEWGFVESCRQQIVQEAPEEYQEDMREHLQQEYARYRAEYQVRNGDVPREPEGMAKQTARFIKEGDRMLAADYLAKAQEKGILAGHDRKAILDHAEALADTDEKEDKLAGTDLRPDYGNRQ